MNPYHHFVSEFVRVAREGAECPLGGIAPLPHPPPRAGRAHGAPFFAASR